MADDWTDAKPPPDTLEEARRQFATLLGRDEPVPESAMLAALEDRLYATHLIASRQTPRALELLLSRPPKRAAATAWATPNSADLLQKFALSMADWARAAFRRAPPEVVERRLAACAACPNLEGTSDAIAHRLASALGLGDRNCRACGCIVQSKAAIETERCPDADPRQSGRSRWGDQLP